MPRKNQNHYDDDFNSEEETETLISRNKPPRQQKPASGKRTSRNSKRSNSPHKNRAHSVPAARTGKDLWINAIQKRQTLGIASGKRSESPRHKTPIEYWLDTFRKTGGDSATMNTFSGLKKTGDKNLAYLSTPHYLRQVVGTEKPGKNNNVTAKPSAGTPAYKTQEEYYDEVLSLRKKISALNQDFATMKAKVRRLEEDNIKKEKEIENLLNPSKSDELRRTLGDRKPDSGAVIHSLKQKILKLEIQLREKEQSYAKLASDLKTTKIDEMKAQMEVFYQEIYRLQQSKDTGTGRGRSGKDNSTKISALNETVIRLSKTNEQLQLENKGLKADLLRLQEQGLDSATGKKGEYEDMNRRELLAELTRLKKRAEKAERRLDTDSLSMASFDSHRGQVAGKIGLRGTLEDRLHQLDQRETELLEEVEKQKSLIKRLKEELSRYRNLKDKSSKPPTPRSSRTTVPQKLPRSGSVDYGFEKKIEEFSKRRAAKSIQQTWRQRQNRKLKEEEEARKVEQFRQNHAAKKIQTHWHIHQQDEAAVDIQATLRGHQNRKIRLRQFDEDSSDGSEDYGDAVDLIKSSLQGHHARKRTVQKIRQDWTDTDEESVYSSGSRRPSSAHHSRPSSAKSGSLRNYSDHSRHHYSTHDEDDADDDIVM